MENRTRASDAEREQTAQLVRAAMGEGRLDLDEGERRLTGVYAASYRDELTPLTADLPDGGWRALATTPEAREHAARRLRIHISGVAVLSGVLIGAWLLSGAPFFWPVFPIVFLTIGVFRHLAWYRSESKPWPGVGWHGHGPWHHHHGRRLSPRDRVASW